MADIVQIEIEIPKMGCVNVDPDIPEKEEISVDAREKSFITHDELFNRDLPDQHPIGAITGLQQALDAAGKVDDVKVDGVSVVDNKIANLGKMAGENYVVRIRRL